MPTFFPAPLQQRSSTLAFGTRLHENLIDRNKARYIAPLFFDTDGGYNYLSASVNKSSTYNNGYCKAAAKLEANVKVNISAIANSKFALYNTDGSFTIFPIGVDTVSVSMKSDGSIETETKDATGAITVATVGAYDIANDNGYRFYVFRLEAARVADSTKNNVLDINAINPAGEIDNSLFLDNILYRQPITPYWDKAMSMPTLQYNNIFTSRIYGSGFSDGGDWHDWVPTFMPGSGYMYDYVNKTVKLLSTRYISREFTVTLMDFNRITNIANFKTKVESTAQTKGYTYNSAPLNVDLNVSSASIWSASTQPQTLTGEPLEFSDPLYNKADNPVASNSGYKVYDVAIDIPENEYRTPTGLRDFVKSTLVTEYELDKSVSKVKYSFTPSVDYAVDKAISVTKTLKFVKNIRQTINVSKVITSFTTGSVQTAGLLLTDGAMVTDGISNPINGWNVRIRKWLTPRLGYSGPIDESELGAPVKAGTTTTVGKTGWTDNDTRANPLFYLGAGVNDDTYWLVEAVKSGEKTPYNTDHIIVVHQRASAPGVEELDCYPYNPVYVPPTTSSLTKGNEVITGVANAVTTKSKAGLYVSAFGNEAYADVDADGNNVDVICTPTSMIIKKGTVEYFNSTFPIHPDAEANRRIVITHVGSYAEDKLECNGVVLTTSRQCEPTISNIGIDTFNSAGVINTNAGIVQPRMFTDNITIDSIDKNPNFFVCNYLHSPGAMSYGSDAWDYTGKSGGVFSMRDKYSPLGFSADRLFFSSPTYVGTKIKRLNYNKTGSSIQVKFNVRAFSDNAKPFVLDKTAVNADAVFSITIGGYKVTGELSIESGSIHRAVTINIYPNGVATATYKGSTFNLTCEQVAYGEIFLLDLAICSASHSHPSADLKKVYVKDISADYIDGATTESIFDTTDDKYNVDLSKYLSSDISIVPTDGLEDLPTGWSPNHRQTNLYTWTSSSGSSVTRHGSEYIPVFGKYKYSVKSREFDYTGLSKTEYEGDYANNKWFIYKYSRFPDSLTSFNALTPIWATYDKSEKDMFTDYYTFKSNNHRYNAISESGIFIRPAFYNGGDSYSFTLNPSQAVSRSIGFIWKEDDNILNVTASTLKPITNNANIITKLYIGRQCIILGSGSEAYDVTINRLTNKCKVYNITSNTTTEVDIILSGKYNVTLVFEMINKSTLLERFYIGFLKIKGDISAIDDNNYELKNYIDTPMHDTEITRSHVHLRDVNTKLRKHNVGVIGDISTSGANYANIINEEGINKVLIGTNGNGNLKYSMINCEIYDVGEAPVINGPIKKIYKNRYKMARQYRLSIDAVADSSLITSSGECSNIQIEATKLWSIKCLPGKHIYDLLFYTVKDDKALGDAKTFGSLYIAYRVDEGNWTHQLLVVDSNLNSSMGIKYPMHGMSTPYLSMLATDINVNITSNTPGLNSYVIIDEARAVKPYVQALWRRETDPSIAVVDITKKKLQLYMMIETHKSTYGPIGNAIYKDARFLFEQADRYNIEVCMYLYSTTISGIGSIRLDGTIDYTMAPVEIKSYNDLLKVLLNIVPTDGTSPISTVPYFDALNKIADTIVANKKADHYQLLYGYSNSTFSDIPIGVNVSSSGLVQSIISESDIGSLAGKYQIADIHVNLAYGENNGAYHEMYGFLYKMIKWVPKFFCYSGKMATVTSTYYSLPEAGGLKGPKSVNNVYALIQYPTTTRPIRYNLISSIESDTFLISPVYGWRMGLAASNTFKYLINGMYSGTDNVKTFSTYKQTGTFMYSTYPIFGMTAGAATRTVDRQMYQEFFNDNGPGRGLYSIENDLKTVTASNIIVTISDYAALPIVREKEYADVFFRNAVHDTEFHRDFYNILIAPRTVDGSTFGSDEKELIKKIVREAKIGDVIQISYCPLSTTLANGAINYTERIGMPMTIISSEFKRVSLINQIDSIVPIVSSLTTDAQISKFFDMFKKLYQGSSGFIRSRFKTEDLNVLNVIFGVFDNVTSAASISSPLDDYYTGHMFNAVVNFSNDLSNKNYLNVVKEFHATAINSKDTTAISLMQKAISELQSVGVDTINFAAEIKSDNTSKLSELTIVKKVLYSNDTYGMHIWFSGYKKIENPNQVYDIGIVLYGKFYGIKLATEPMEYHLWVKNPSPAAGVTVNGPNDVSVEGYCMKEYSDELSEIYELPLVIVDKFIERNSSSDPFIMYAYSLNQDIVIDRIHIPGYTEGALTTYRRPPLPLRQYIPTGYFVEIDGTIPSYISTGFSDSYPYSGGTSGSGWYSSPGDIYPSRWYETYTPSGGGYGGFFPPRDTPATYPPTGSTSWPDGDFGTGILRPDMPKPTYTGTNGSALPPMDPSDLVLPPGDVCVDKWIRDLIMAQATKYFDAASWNNIVSTYGSINNWLNDLSNPTDWLFMDASGNTITATYDSDKACFVITDKDRAKFKKKVKFIDSPIFSYTLKKPTTSVLDCSSATAREIMAPCIQSDPDIVIALNGVPAKFGYKIESIKPLNDYPFVQADNENPYSPDADRPLSETMGDIDTVIRGYDALVGVTGGYDGQKYTAEDTVEKTLSYLDGTIDIVKKSELELVYKNIYDEIYSDSLTSAIYSSTIIKKDAPVVLDYVWQSDILIKGYANNDSVSSYAQTYTFSDTAPTKTSVLNELIPSITDGTYKVKVSVIGKDGIIKMNGNDLSLGESLPVSLGQTDTLAFTAEPRKFLVPWNKVFDNEGELYSDTVNGQELYRNPYDGKHNLRIPMPMFELPEGFEQGRYEISVLDAPGKQVKAKFDNQIAMGATENQGDYITFSSSYTEPMTLTKKFRTIEVQGELLSTDTMLPKTVKHKLHNPVLEGADAHGRITDMSVVIQSDNPNIKVVEYDNEVNFGEDEFKTLDVTIKPMNESSSNWHPRVHNGYYYFNNHEHFLYSNSKPNGTYKMEEQYDDIDLVYTIKGTILGDNAAGTSEQLDFGGYDQWNQGIGIKTKYEKGDIFCTMLADTTYYKEYNLGIFESQEIVFEKLPSSWGAFSWDTETPEGTDVKMFMRTYDEKDLAWGPWIEIYNNGVPVVPVSKKIQYRAELRPSIIVAPSVINDADSTSTDFISIDAKAENVRLDNDKIELINPAEPGMYISKIADYFHPVSSYSVSLFGTGSTELFVASSNNSDDLRNPVWTPAASVAQNHRYYMYKVVLAPNSEVYEVRRTVNCMTSVASTPSFKDMHIILQYDGAATGLVIEKPMVGTISANGEWNEITQNDISVMLYTDIINKGFKLSNLVLVKVESQQEIEFMYHPQGNSVLQARTKFVSKSIKPSKYFDFIGDKCEISPIPQQFAPVIIYDENVGYLNRVNFLDNQGKQTLTYSASINGQGRKVVQLTHTGIDTSTMSLKINGSTVEFKDCRLKNNMLELPKELSFGEVLDVSYKLINSFYVDYNHNVLEDKALIVAHTTEPLVRSTVYYECNKDSADKVIEDINLNTVYAPDNYGFVFLSDEVNSASSLEVNANPRVLKGDGKDATNVYIRVTDSYGNAVSGDALIIEAEHGRLMLKSNITDQYGVVVCKYMAPEGACTDTITVTSVDSGLSEAINMVIKPS